VAAEATTEISPGGIEYVRLYIPDTEDVAIQIAWPDDWVMREGVNQAVADLGADLIFAGGAEGFPPGEVSEVHADLNAQATVWLTSDHLHAEIITPKDNLEEAVESTAAHLSAPSMDAAWFERVRQGNISTMAEEISVPINRGYEAMRWIILGDTPLRRALSGDEPEMYSMAKREEVLEWHRTTVVRSGAEIVIAGAIEADVAGKTVDTLFARLPEGKPCS
jgi:predicted Zn-dependent peptidase